MVDRLIYEFDKWRNLQSLRGAVFRTCIIDQMVFEIPPDLKPRLPWAYRILSKYLPALARYLTGGYGIHRFSLERMSNLASRGEGGRGAVG